MRLQSASEPNEVQTKRYIGYAQKDYPGVESDEPPVVVPRPRWVDELEVAFGGGTRYSCASTHNLALVARKAGLQAVMGGTRRSCKGVLVRSRERSLYLG